MDNYNLDNLLDRLYSQLSKMTGGSKKYVLPKPESTILNKRTIISNIQEIAKELKREPTDIQSYLSLELGTSTSFSGEGHMIIVGIFKQGAIEKNILRYITECVQCTTCKSIDTFTKKEDRITFLCCNKCKALKSIK